MTVSLTLTQTDTKDKTELDFPRAYERQAHTAFVFQQQASSEYDVDATVCVLTTVGSVEEENINYILEANEEAIAAGNPPVLDVKVTGEVILPNMYKLGNPEKFPTYYDAISKLSLSDEDDLEMPDAFVLVSTVEASNVDDPKLHTFSAASANVYAELVEQKGKPAWTSYEVSFAGQNPDRNHSTGNNKATLSSPDVRECVKELLVVENTYLANSAVAGNIGFYTSKKDGETVVRFPITKLYPGEVKLKSNGTSLETRGSVPLSKEAAEPPKDLKDAKSVMLAARKARQDKENAEAAANVEDF